MQWALTRKPGARQALAVYLRSIVRGTQATAQAAAILNKSNTAFETALRDVVADLKAATDAAPDISMLLDVVRSAHSRLGFPRGEETWVLAKRQLQRAARLMAGGGSVDVLEAEVDRLRAETLVGIAAARPKPVQLMNLHQTKGREAEATVLVLQDDEYHGREREPFPTGSRLLYVCMTRARERAHIVVPDQVHHLWLPLVNACIRIARETTASRAGALTWVGRAHTFRCVESRDTSVESTIEWWAAQAKECLARAGSPAVLRPVVEDVVPPDPAG